MSLFFYTDKTNCGIVVLDSKTKEPVESCRVFSRSVEYAINDNGVFQIPCDFNDSIMVVAPGYSDTLFVYQHFDTIQLSENSFELETVTVLGQSKKKKTYQIGKKNRKCNSSYAFWTPRQNEIKPLDFSLVSFIPNDLNEKKQIEEGYVYVMDKDSLTNLNVSFYKNNDGKIGEPIAINIPLENIKSTRGWCKILFEKKMNLPKNGFYIAVKKNNVLGKGCVGMISYKAEKNMYCYSTTDISNPNVNYDFKNQGIKLFFKVK